MGLSERASPNSGATRRQSRSNREEDEHEGPTLSLERFAAPAVLVGSDGREHDICCRLLVRGDNPLRDFVGTLHGDLDGIAWSELVGHRVMIGLEDHNYWVHIVTAREHSADIEDFAYAGARPHLVGAGPLPRAGGATPRG